MKALTLDTMSQVTHETVTATMITADIQVTCALVSCAILSLPSAAATQTGSAACVYIWTNTKLRGSPTHPSGLSLPSTLPLCGWDLRRAWVAVTHTHTHRTLPHRRFHSNWVKIERSEVSVWQHACIPQNKCCSNYIQLSVCAKKREWSTRQEFWLISL